MVESALKASAPLIQQSSMNLLSILLTITLVECTKSIAKSGNSDKDKISALNKQVKNFDLDIKSLEKEVIKLLKEKESTLQTRNELREDFESQHADFMAEQERNETLRAKIARLKEEVNRQGKSLKERDYEVADEVVDLNESLCKVRDELLAEDIEISDEFEELKCE